MPRNVSKQLSVCGISSWIPSPHDFDREQDGETKTINYIARGVTEHVKYELGLFDNQQWIVLKWIQTYLDWELFCNARQIASTAIGHEELHEMTKRAVLTVPMSDLQKPRPMTMESRIFLADPPEPTPRLSLARSDSLSPLSSYSAMPPSITREKGLERNIISRDPRRQAAVTRQMQMIPDPSGADGLLHPRWAIPEQSIQRPSVLGWGTPLWPAVPLAVPGPESVPLPGMTVAAAPLPDVTVTAAPLPDMAVTAAPLPDTTVMAAPLPDMTIATAPLPEMVAATAPLSEEHASMARSSPSTMPTSGVGSPNHPSSVGSTNKKAIVEPAQPDNYWITEEGTSGPLPVGAESPAPPQTDSVLSTEQPPAGVYAIGPAPLAVLESSEISQEGSPRRPSGSKDVPAGNTHSLARPHAGHPSVAEILQQQVVWEQIVVTTVKSEEIIEQPPPGAGAEPMVISGRNTPVAPDDEELDTDDEQELLMDETRL